MFASIYLCLQSQAQSQESANRQTISLAEAVFDNSFSPPPDSAAWTTVPLPMQARDFPEQEPGSAVWLRIVLPDAGYSESMGLFVWRHYFSLMVFLDSVAIGAVDPHTIQRPNFWNRPTLVALGNLQNRGNSSVFLRLSPGEMNTFGISSLLFAPMSELRELYEDRYFWQVETAQWAFQISIILGVFSLWLWYRRRQDKIYATFTLTCFTGSVVPLYMAIDFMPLPQPIWLLVLHGAVDWYAYLLFRFMNRAANFGLHKTEKSLLYLGLLASVSHLSALFSNDVFFLSAYGFHIIQNLFILYLAIVCFREAAFRGNSPARWFAFGFVAILILGLHDVIYFLLVPVEQSINATHWFQFILPVLLIILFAHLVDRFIQALDETERFYQEKERVYRDLHDDVGSKLLSIVHSAPDDRSESLARDALLSLREAISRTQYSAQSLPVLLEQITEEMELRLSGASIQFTQANASPLKNIKLGADTCYHLSRICREVISNVIQHSNAKIFSLRIRLDGHTLNMEFADDGVGFRADVRTEGHGLTNLRYRAEQLLGTIQWSEPARGGTAILLTAELITDQLTEEPKARKSPKNVRSTNQIAS